MIVRFLGLLDAVCLILAVWLLTAESGPNALYAVLLLLAAAVISAVLAVRAAYGKARSIVRDARAFMSGDIQHVRLLEVSEPRGLFFTKVNFVLELEGADGRKHQFDRGIPTPFFAAWAYRLGKRVKLPFLRRFEPSEMLAVELRREGMKVSVSRGPRDGAAPSITSG